MPTYRRANDSDAATITAFWNLTRVQNMLNGFGYQVVPISVEEWKRDMANRSKVFLALDDSNNLRGVVEFIVTRSTREGWMARWAVDPNLTLAQIRTHRNAVLTALWRALPNDWTVWVYKVPAGAVRLREYLDTRLPFTDEVSTIGILGQVRNYGPITAGNL